MADDEEALISRILEQTLDRSVLINEPYYSIEWFRQCARAVLQLEMKRSWFSNAAEIADALIRRSTEARAGEAKGMSAFFMPTEALEADDVLRGAALDKQISYWEMIQQERKLNLPQTIHPVDLALFCNALHIAYLPVKKPDSELSSTIRPTPKPKRGAGKKRSK